MVIYCSFTCKTRSGQTSTITPTSTNQSVFNNFGLNRTKGAPKASNFISTSEIQQSSRIFLPTNLYSTAKWS
ncbi:hypothetical protein RIR_jg2205.t1 [Rhizophagus irregularis DAOM 181602=DAOM 197198]|nr:hypothetical protein RIR_jg2205.t1 [Rhizophagus irregularis DAOM 181602=DAOM 197198]